MKNITPLINMAENLAFKVEAGKIEGKAKELLFMVNHLYRSKATKRHEQATGLNDWAKTQTLPVIAVGDYNFDWSIPTGDTNHDKGYDNMVINGVFTWVRPETLVKTHCSHHNGVLDFVFVSGDAQSWN